MCVCVCVCVCVAMPPAAAAGGDSIGRLRRALKKSAGASAEQVHDAGADAGGNYNEC